MSDDCPVCCDKYTVQLRKPVCCPYCDFSACNVCSKRYLTEGLLDAHCMSCRRAWNDEFLDLNFTKAFRTGQYKKHRENVLLDREIALLPTRQPLVEATIKLEAAHENIDNVNKELRELEKKRAEILARSHRFARLITRYTAEAAGRPPPAWTLDEGERPGAKAERAKFVMKCPDGECRGFLSTAYKCGTCQKWACPDCLDIKGLDKDVEHTCDPGQKESVALIIKESKSCPKCGERISKIDGCDQMWCVDCHTAFSWTTGQLVNGVVHNPHYYEFLRTQGNGVAPRNAGDVPCGGVPYYNHMHNALSILPRTTSAIFTTIHRVTSEIADFRIRAYQGHFNVDDNSDLGVEYLMKKKSKEDIKVELARRELKRNKHLAIRAILEMFATTSTMMLNNIVSHPPGDEYKKEWTDKRKIYDEKNKIYSTMIKGKTTEELKQINATFEELSALHKELDTYKEGYDTVCLKEANTVLTEYENLRKYVNESLMGVSRMKNCSVPQIGEKWEWKPFNKYVPKKRGTKAAAVASPATASPAAAAVEDEVPPLVEDSD
jgi:hypothetical protein